jgi:hypothetical protein
MSALDGLRERMQRVRFGGDCAAAELVRTYEPVIRRCTHVRQTGPHLRPRLEPDVLRMRCSRTLNRVVAEQGLDNFSEPEFGPKRRTTQTQKARCCLDGDAGHVGGLHP